MWMIFSLEPSKTNYSNFNSYTEKQEHDLPVLGSAQEKRGQCFSVILQIKGMLFGLVFSKSFFLIYLLTLVHNMASYLIIFI